MCLCVFFFSVIKYIVRNEALSTYLNHYSLGHQYQYSFPPQCHYLMNYLPWEMMSYILGIVICYQDHMMTWLWRSLSSWHSRKCFRLILCYYLQEDELENNGRVILRAHISYTKNYYPEYMILLWRVLSSVI